MTEKRLRPKYMVFKMTETGTMLDPGMRSTDPDNADSPFVLMPRKDPAAYYALLHYAQVCEDSLAAEIRIWLDKVIEAPAAYGTQGDRNRIAMKKMQMDLFT